MFKLLLFFLCGCSALAGADFEAANRKYEEGQYSEAKQMYEDLVRDGHMSGNVFYNLGNAEYKLGMKGPAMLSYERALALEPGLPEAKANLQLLRGETGARLAQKNMFKSAFEAFGANTYAIITSVAVWGCLFGAVLRFSSQIRSWFPAVAFFVVGLTAALGLWVHQQDKEIALVIAAEGEGRFAPAENATLVGKLPMGSHVRVLADRGTWAYVELPDGKRAWMASGALQKIHMDS